MRASGFSLLVVLAVGSGCADTALSSGTGAGSSVTPGPAAPLAGRVRLTASWSPEWQDGFRFADAALITTHRLRSGEASTTEVRGKDGVLLQGDGQRTDVQFGVSRQTYLRASGEALCLLPDLYASLAAVPAEGCASFTQLAPLQVNAPPPYAPSAAGLALVLRTESSGVYRLWVAESGNDFVLFDYEAEPERP